MDSDLCLGIIIVAVLIFIIGLILVAFPGLKSFLAIIAPIMIGLGVASRTLNKEDEEDNKCRNCGHELDGDANFCPICGTKRI